MNEIPSTEIVSPDSSARLARTVETDHAREFARTLETLTPTEAVCKELQGAYSYYNRLLFNDELPECMLTMHERSMRSLGYYRPYGFQSADGVVVDQISMNPAIGLKANPKGPLSILVHEMCHLQVNNFCLDKKGKRKRISAYHCMNWVRAMERVGLVPSNTGKPGGKKTGYSLSHYVVESGPFDQATAALLKNGFAITWGLARTGMYKGDGENGENSKTEDRKKKDRTKGKAKFECPTCKKPCWAAPTRKLICGDDSTALVPVY